ncbi:hypothetical protein [Polynucleobacter sp. MWH-HuK1]|uniref:SGNH/GDSL hydrolase family protein n=1 Tax=Polynucleobacter sp. MWH-HuK1 TaxID=1743158 RepID=UPI001C0BFC53|nr:hypothetical protein [Polynucleobacter sp. MWH-HuK1]MBU3564459.1 hypothetical protein [Polynucleobacter sp. MWH-HuK1]
MNQYKSFAILLLSIVLALIMLIYYEGKRIQAEDFALGKENTSRSEAMDGIPFTGHTLPEINAIVSHYSGESKQQKIVLWLSNSQLHTINQFKQGEHLAPYWMRNSPQCGGCFVPLGLSLSNANPQEEFILAQFVQSKLAVKALVLQVEFMGFRESGLRQDFSDIATDKFVNSLLTYSVGRELALLANNGKEVESEVKQGAYGESVDKGLEDLLSSKLGSVWQLWEKRGNLRASVLGDLFEFRNWVFNISSTSQRKIIKPRYEKNMKALEDMLARSKADMVPLVMYIAPVRQDKPLPYDRKEYSEWKIQIEQLANKYSAKYLDLEKLVPAEDWGSNFGEDIDFMHFQENGHKLLAKELLPVIQSNLK